jgi:ParB/RepB/Spo0J family partition protein
MEDTHGIVIKEIEIAHLELRYAHIRIQRHKDMASIANSLHRTGQVSPVIVVPQEAPSYILIDGYLRVAALRSCGKDTVLAQVWDKEDDALIQVLAGSQQRTWNALEQAGLIRELCNRHNLSQPKIAALVGKDQSWVSRRLGLLEVLSEEILALVRKGCVSTWAATRVLVPMARAIPDHAATLTKSLVKAHLSTRDLVEFYRHYQKAPRKTRHNMVSQPALFVKALTAHQQDKQAAELKDGPEGRWLKDIKLAGHIVGRLIKQVSTVFYEDQRTWDRRLLLTAFEETSALFEMLNHKIRRLYEDDDPGNTTDHRNVTSEGNRHPADQPHAQAITKNCSSHTAQRDTRGDSSSVPLPGSHAHDQGSVFTLSG